MKKWQLFLIVTVIATVMIVPVAEASTYTVKKGDTLSKIATKHETTITILKELNKLQTDTIYVAQKLAIPKTNSVVGGTNTTTPSIIEPTTVQNYKVVKGDTLSKIATKNKVTIAELKRWNQLEKDVIYVGQTLVIQGVTAPTESATTTTVDKEISMQLAKETVNKSKLSVATSKKYKKLLTMANDLIGIPYVFGGNTPEGFDCSGLVHYLYQNAGFQSTRKSSLDYFMKDTTKVDQPVPGDLVFFKNTYISTISHMGIYIGDNQFIHAGSNGVEISKLSYAYWDTRFVAFKRFNQVK